jgi:hypothetical protein
MAIPISPGKRDAFREFTQALAGPKSKEFADMEKRTKTNKETWFLQPSPKGDTVVVYFECEDLQSALQNLATSKNTFDVWFKDELGKITGMDFNKPMDGPMPEQVLNYKH